MPTKPKRRRPVHGLYARNLPRPVRWKVDFDYVARLSPEEQEWLSDFVDAEYGADYRNEIGQEYDVEDRRVTDAQKLAARSDVYGLAQSGGFLGEFQDRHSGAEPMTPEAPTPEYLDSPEYKRARDEYRATLAQGRRNHPPKPTRKHTQAKKHLERTVRNAQAESAEGYTRAPDADDTEPS